MNRAEHAEWLPDFCRLPVLFVVLVVAELIVLVILLAPGPGPIPGATEFLSTSLFAEWLALTTAVVLCKARPMLMRWPRALGVAGACLVPGLIAAGGSALVWWLDYALGFRIAPPEPFLVRFVICNSVLTVLIAAATLRYFYVQELWKVQVRAHAKVELDALQARIRPHFLFNSMNTIASLVRADPDQAERAIEDLSDLFRAALGAGREGQDLRAELALVDGYLRIEALRLGARLTVRRTLDDLPLDLAVPPLLVQPLVENAVHHGIAQLGAGGTIEIAARRSGDELIIEVRNPCPLEARAMAGHGMALDNIRQRLRYHYGPRGKLEVERGAGYYAATLRLPLT